MFILQAINLMIPLYYLIFKVHKDIYLILEIKYSNIDLQDVMFTDI